MSWLKCVRCGVAIDRGSLFFRIGEALGDVQVTSCGPCHTRWLAAAESKRLHAISISIVSEWLERERCEALALKVAQEEEAAAAAAISSGAVTPSPEPEKT